MSQLVTEDVPTHAFEKNAEVQEINLCDDTRNGQTSSDPEEPIDVAAPKIADVPTDLNGTEIVTTNLSNLVDLSVVANASPEIEDKAALQVAS